MPNPNPLFLRWVKGFHAEKDYKIRGGPPRPTGYENAIQSLQNCTTRYEHPLEMKGLFGVGPTCIARLTEKLEEYCNERGLEMPEPPAKKTRAKAKAAPAPAKVDDVEKYANSEEEANPVKKPRARATKRSTRAKRPRTFTPEYANSEEEANPVKKPRTKVDPKAAARKAEAALAEANDAPEENVEPTKKARAPRKTTASSAKRKRDEEEDDGGDNAVESNPPAKTRRTSRRTKAPVSYAE